MGRKKSVDSTQILFVCLVGMITLFAGLILFGVIQSYLNPDVTVGKESIEKVVKSEEGDIYHVVFSVKNNEKKSVKVELKTALGFDVYRMRHSTSPKPNFYRVFQVLKEATEELVLPPKVDQEIRATVEIGQDIYEKFEIKPETKIYPRITAKKVSWEES